MWSFKLSLVASSGNLSLGLELCQPGSDTGQTVHLDALLPQALSSLNLSVSLQIPLAILEAKLTAEKSPNS